MLMYPAFRSEVIGTTVPNCLAVPLYKMFCSHAHSQLVPWDDDMRLDEIDCVMTFEDFASFYHTLNRQVAFEMA